MYNCLSTNAAVSQKKWHRISYHKSAVTWHPATHPVHAA